ncbi:MAG: cytochrome c oxidase subunit I [Acidobacteriaceae bacterium]|nr:cytochrome c oxidase subunit I [Acidobacteriaceae bacterium]MBV9225162.1 cytochrome c oxidase subunit I [Acidobacteriaceae bacterium]MBV9306791.1 cytochrome c oxidase subunit I [Acidobacteriaceae bacterium]MBV9679651.1 cytochrome c oxidase subunit I [Acidobacteriaceae bacterium]MBV9937163.1 cytochrome c oxidase subunit I [Acidobacteriaceae bacterium]
MATIDYPLDRPRAVEKEFSFSETLYKWVATVDHKRLGLMYIVSSIIFFVIAGLEATVIRTQLIFPNLHVVDPDTYNRLFTMHGTTMVFLVGMPFIAGFANYLVPLMIGARDMAFPRLNAFGFWIFLFGGLLLYFSYIGGGGLGGSGSAPDVGWFAYAPLTERAFSRGHATDYWILGILVSGIGSIASAINVIVTTISMRCPGMTLTKMPMFVWTMLVDSWLIVIALPPLTAAQIMLLLDRYLGANFFNTQKGGSAVLWQHFFWIFGHPEVYILIFLAFACLNEVVPVFSRKPIFGRQAMVGALVAIGFISLGVWAHHMFSVGMTSWSNTFFAASTVLVGVPTGIKIFNWTATMYGGKLRMTVPMLFCCAFLLQFLCAGLTGIMLGMAPFDWQLTDSYFVVAHFHYTLAGGLVFGIFAGLYYWYPKVTGRMFNEKWGKWHFWLFVIGFNLTFLPQHMAGFLGMPRRIYTYPAGRGWELWNFLSSCGVPFQLAAILFFAVNFVYSARKGEPAGDDPWDAWTLEWATTSPPPEYNFEKLPVVRSSRPLWDLKHPQDPDWKYNQ